MGRVVLAGVAVAAVVALTACGERSEPTGPAARLYPITITAANGDKALHLKAPAKRIAVLEPDIGQIVHDLGAGGSIAATPLAANGAVKVAALRAARPDLLVASSETDDSVLAAAGRALHHVPVYVAQVGDIRGVERTIVQLGLITNRSVAARRFVRTIENRRRAIDRRLAGSPRVSVFFDRGFRTTVSNQSLVGDLLREAHARNVAGEAPQVGPFDPAQLLRLNPSYYLATSDSGTTLRSLLRNKQLRKLAAILQRHFAVVDARLLDPGPRIADGLARLASLLHPDAFR